MLTKPVELLNAFSLPEGWVLLGIDDIFLSVIEVNDTPAIRYRLDVRGHDVQIIHDGNDQCVTVFVDERPELLNKSEIAGFIRQHAV